MKRLIAGACFALVASSAFAADPFYPVEEQARQISGYGQIYAGGMWVKFDSGDSEDDLDFWAAGASGQINVPFAESWNVQGGLALDGVGTDGDNLVGFGGQGHVFWRDPSSYALGGFAEIKTYDYSEGGPTEDIWDWKIGPEAQVYFDRVTLYGQAWYGQFEIEEAPVDIDVAGVRGVVRYFARDNLRFDGEVAFNRISADGLDVDTVALALQAMYRISDTPFSVFGRYQFETTSFDAAGPFNDEDIDSHKLVVGLRASFGSSTLIDEDRNGATMDTFRSNLVTSGL